MKFASLSDVRRSIEALLVAFAIFGGETAKTVTINHYCSGSVPTGDGNSLMTPEVVIRPTFRVRVSANQRLPSGPGVIPCGLLAGVGIANSVTEAAFRSRPVHPPHRTDYG